MRQWQLAADMPNFFGAAQCRRNNAYLIHCLKRSVMSTWIHEDAEPFIQSTLSYRPCAIHHIGVHQQYNNCLHDISSNSESTEGACNIEDISPAPFSGTDSRINVPLVLQRRGLFCLANPTFTSWQLNLELRVKVGTHNDIIDVVTNNLLLTNNECSIAKT